MGPTGQGYGQPPPNPSPSGGGGGGGQGFFTGARHRTESFLSNTASTAIGVGLGSSLMGFPLAAIQRYMQLSTVLTQVSAKFRELGDDSSKFSSRFGTDMGYGLARTAQLSETLGRVQNRFSREDGTRMAGFGRFTGADQGANLASLGTLGRLQGRNLSDAELVNLHGVARRQNMDQGRIEEFLQQVQHGTMQQFGATGRMDIGGALAAQGLPAHVFGSRDPRSSDDSLTQGLHGVLTGGGPMKTYMMRAMGYGAEGGPGYVEMRKRLDAGVFDKRNIGDLFGSFMDRGMGEGAQFRAIESVAGGQLKAHQIEGLVKSLGNRQGLSSFLSGDTGSNMEAFKSTLSDDERKAFEKGGFGELGKLKISAGEGYENRIESMMMSMGSTLAPAIPALQETIENIFGVLNNMFKLVGGEDFGGTLKRGAEAIERLTDQLKVASGEKTREGYERLGEYAEQHGNVSAAKVLYNVAAGAIGATKYKGVPGDPSYRSGMGQIQIGGGDDFNFEPLPQGGSGE